ncbi:TetR family transcriptional regulator, partial [Burkholderia multivorans]
ALIVRHVVVLEPLASVPLDEVIARVGPALQGHIDGRGG